jgi:hypothetical protein
MPLSRAYRHRRGLETGREWIKDAIDLKVNSVCESCNGGWMDRLDHEVEDMFLTHAAHGFDVKLASMAQRATLARWCALIATLSDQTNRPPVVPERIPAIIYAGEVPEDMSVWLFRTEPPDGRDIIWKANRHLTITAERRSGVTDSLDFHFVTFCILQLVVHVAQPTEWTSSGVRIWQTGTRSLGFSRTLWPSEFTPLIWPPPNTMRWEDALDFPDLLHREYGQPDEPPN